MRRSLGSLVAALLLTCLMMCAIAEAASPFRRDLVAIVEAPRGYGVAGGSERPRYAVLAAEVWISLAAGVVVEPSSTIR